MSKQDYYRHVRPDTEIDYVPVLTLENSGYDGDPNDVEAPEVLNFAPKGALYMREGTLQLYQKLGHADDAGWVLRS